MTGAEIWVGDTVRWRGGDDPTGKTIGIGEQRVVGITSMPTGNLMELEDGSEFWEYTLELVEQADSRAQIPGRQGDPEFVRSIENTLDAIKTLLISKNRSYGNSALEPVRIFSKSDEQEGIRVRIDDKLSRIARGSDLGEDVINDLIGYLVLLKISQEYGNM